MDNTDSTGRGGDAAGFDQTNDLAGDQLGESDGTAEGELLSAAERGDGSDSLRDTDEKSEGVRGDGDVFPGNVPKVGDGDVLPGNPARGGAGGI